MHSVKGYLLVCQSKRLIVNPHTSHHLRKHEFMLINYVRNFLNIPISRNYSLLKKRPSNCSFSCSIWTKLLNESQTSSFRHNQTSSKDTHIDFCIELVRKSDYENYLATLLLPKEIQRAAFALRAFNIELSQVRDNVSDKQIALMKLQFWKDSMGKICQGQPPQKPAAIELAGACGFHKLTKQYLDRIIKARISQVKKDYFLSINDVENFSEHANSSLYYLLLECLNVNDVNANQAASHLGKAHGLVTLIRGIPYHAQRRCVLLPIDVLASNKVSQEDIIRGKDSQPVKDVMFDIASVANQHLEEARSLRTSLPQKCYTVFLNAAVCDFYLKALQQADFNVFNGKLQNRNNLLPFSMYMNKLRKRF